MNSPIISILIPTHDRATLLPEARRRALPQTPPTTQLLVLHNPTTDAVTTTHDTDLPTLIGLRWTLFGTTRYCEPLAVPHLVRHRPTDGSGNS